MEERIRKMYKEMISLKDDIRQQHLSGDYDNEIVAIAENIEKIMPVFRNWLCDKMM